MGAQNSANLNLKPSLDIKLHRKSRKDTILINLMQGDEICPTMPKPELIKKQLLEIFKNIEMDPKQKEKVLKLKPSLQWRLICSHNNFLKKNEETIEQVSKSESQNFIEKLKNNPSIITMQNLRRWLKKAALSDLRSFFLFDGVNILFKMLEVAELCSRNTKRYAKQIEILKIIQLISKHKEGLEEILKVSNSFTYVFFNLHPTHVELTCLVFEIIGGLLWNSNAAFELMLSSLNKLKTEKDYIFKFYPFLHILRHSNNVIMIENTLMFLNILLSSNNESHWRLSIKSELLACGIKHTIEVFIIFLGRILIRIFFFFLGHKKKPREKEIQNFGLHI